MIDRLTWWLADNIGYFAPYKVFNYEVVVICLLILLCQLTRWHNPTDPMGRLHRLPVPIRDE